MNSSRMPDTTLPSKALFAGAVTVDGGRVQLSDPSALQSAHTDALVHQAVFGAEADRINARWLLWELGQIVGVRPASIHDLYIARGAGKCHGFTVPAINVRGMSYDTARSIFRTAIAQTRARSSSRLHVRRSRIPTSVRPSMSR
jgi:hypothetical protein